MSTFEAGKIREPLLQFAHNQCEEHPKDGLFLYGPQNLSNQGGILKFGVIGSKEGIELFSKWAKTVSGFIPPYKEDSAHHSPFPGFEAAFGLKWPEKPIAEVKVNAEKVKKTIAIGNRHEAIKKTVDIYADAIQTYLNDEADVTPDFWYVIIPEEVFQYGRPKKAPPIQERTQGTSKMSAKQAKKYMNEPSLFDEQNEEASLLQYSLNFHNQLKAILLSKATIQILCETTLLGGIGQTDLAPRSTQGPASIAWNLCTTSYYKSSGPPWRLKDIREGVCYVGIVFKKDPSDLEGRNACCGAQLFLRSGEGLVFKGAVGPWYSKALKQFHLPREKAAELMRLVISGYERIHGYPPKEIFIHGRTRFDYTEWVGFNDAITDEKTKIVGIRIKKNDELKLYRLATQPPVRGTYLQTSEKKGYLWSTGYVN